MAWFELGPDIEEEKEEEEDKRGPFAPGNTPTGDTTGEAYSPPGSREGATGAEGPGNDWRGLQERLNAEAFAAREKAGDSAQNRRDWLPLPATGAPAPRPTVPPTTSPTPGGTTLPFVGAPTTPTSPLPQLTTPGTPLPATGAPAPATSEPTGSGFRDIDELRAEPWSTEFEQSALARADELASERYNVLRKKKSMEMAQRGLDPRSRLYGRAMDEIDRDQAREASSFRRDLQLRKIGERERRTAAARGVEYQLDQTERQRLMDLVAILSGDPNYTMGASQIGASLAGLLGQQQALATQSAADSFGGLGDLFGMLLSQQENQD